MSTRHFSPKAAVIALVVLGALGALGAGIWFYPPALLYGMLAVAGVVAYAAVYFIVLGTMRRRAETHAARRAPEATQQVAENEA